MADDARQSLPDLSLEPDKVSMPLPETMDFFELLRRLERDGRLFGHSGRPEREPARLCQNARLGFAVQDVVAFSPSTDTMPARVVIANFGLLGPEGPLPLHMTRWVLDRLSQRWFAGANAQETSDTTFLDFANILQHRMIALFYRAWADAHPEVQVEREAGGGQRAMLAALAGIGLPGTQDRVDSRLDAVKLRQAPALAHQVDGPERLTRFIAEVFGVPVRLKEFVGNWMTIPAALQTRLGSDHAVLGRGATLGPRSFQRQNRIELYLGPIGLADYEMFLPGGEQIETLRTAIRTLVGDGIDVDLRIVLVRGDVPAASIGTSRLGRTAWLAPRDERGDAEDMRLRTIVGWRPETAGAAA
jgi:type VI secretion system protein ImpH